MNKTLSMKSVLLTAAALLFTAAGAYAQQTSEMQNSVEYLASQRLAGRYPSSVEDDMSTAYILTKLQSYGLRAFTQDFSFRKTMGSPEIGIHNIVAVLPGSNPALRNEFVVVGAHYDHLGMGGKNSGSRQPDVNAIHPGADDNASGVATVLEMAKRFAQKGSPRSLVFVLFGAEEQGIVGSKNFVDWIKQPGSHGADMPENLGSIVEMVNFDMVGRLREDALSIGGTGTSNVNQQLVDAAAKATGLTVNSSEDGYGPSDHASFTAQGIPVLYISTGGHMEYHTPADTPETVNFEGMDKVADYSEYLIESVCKLDKRPEYIDIPAPQTMTQTSFKVTLGLMPDVTGGGKTPGLRADIVVKGKPAYEAGMRSGDIIQEIDGKKIADIQEYMQRLAELKAGTTIPVKVLRGEEIITLNVKL